MLRLSPSGDERLFQSPEMRTFFGGTEANVAVSLAHFGLESSYLTRLPEGPVGDAALSALRAEDVDVAHVVRGGRRLGLYYVELGAEQRPMRVIYDRAGSAASEMTPETFDWASVFDGAAWFHTTGITPALGPKALATTRAALEEAQKVGVTVSFDINYRQQLWTPKKARSTLRPLLEHVDVLIANPASLRDGLGLTFPQDEDEQAGFAADCVREFGLSHLAVTLRQAPSASRNVWSAVLLESSSQDLYRSRAYEVRLIDRVGAGDAFAAGLIYSLLQERPAASALEFAVAAGALKHTIPGDFNRVTVEEAERLVACGD